MTFYKEELVLTLFTLFLFSYENMLEVPLQPLSDNLDSYTYEVFEADPVKYKLYQNAVQAALLDRVSDEEAKSKLVRKNPLFCIYLFLIL